MQCCTSRSGGSFVEIRFFVIASTADTDLNYGDTDSLFVRTCLDEERMSCLVSSCQRFVGSCAFN